MACFGPSRLKSNSTSLTSCCSFCVFASAGVWRSQSVFSRESPGWRWVTSSGLKLVTACRCRKVLRHTGLRGHSERLALRLCLDWFACAAGHVICGSQRCWSLALLLCRLTCRRFRKTRCCTIRVGSWFTRCGGSVSLSLWTGSCLRKRVGYGKRSYLRRCRSSRRLGSFRIRSIWHTSWWLWSPGAGPTRVGHNSRMCFSWWFRRWSFLRGRSSGSVKNRSWPSASLQQQRKVIHRWHRFRR